MTVEVGPQRWREIRRICAGDGTVIRRWCIRCQAWHDPRQFGRGARAADGVARSCRASWAVGPTVSAEEDGHG